MTQIEAFAQATGEAEGLLWIGGEFRPARSGVVRETSAPATGELIGRVHMGAAEDIDDAVAAAVDAGVTWRRVPMAERARLVVELASRIEANLDHFGRLDARDMGSPFTAMRGSATKGATYLRMVAGVAMELTGRVIPASAHGWHVTRHAPWGVVGGITAYNHPILFAAQKMGPALVAGNTVVLKPSEQASLSTLGLAALTADLFPEGVINVVPGGAEAGAALAGHPSVPRLTMTGGVRSALAVQRAAADSGTFKVLTLELGGKNPIVVCADANLDDAAAAVVRGMNFTRNQGQSCGATSRLLVHADIKDTLMERVLERVTAIRLGIPERPETEMGSLVSEAHRRRVLGYVESARSEGARVLFGGGPPDDPELAAGAYVKPTVIDEVTAKMTVAREEIFGPVLSVVEWSDEDDVVSLANDTEYGLTASVWAQDIDRALRLADQIEAGYIWVNDIETRYPGVPFGGWKLSGIGKEQALVEELASFTQSKSINVAVRQAG